jgi:hypothetical protein
VVIGRRPAELIDRMKKAAAALAAADVPVLLGGGVADCPRGGKALSRRSLGVMVRSDDGDLA